MNYEPNLLARSLASSKKTHLATLLPFIDSETPYWKSHVAALESSQKQLAPFGIKFSYYHFKQGNAKSFKEQLVKIMEGEFDGVIMVPIFSEETRWFVNNTNIPIVFIDTDIPHVEEVCYIGQNASDSGILAARMLGFSIQAKQTCVVLNVSRDKDEHVNYMKRARGFIEYTKQAPEYENSEVVKLNLDSDDEIEDQLQLLITKGHHIHSIFVSNSRSYFVAQLLTKLKLKSIKIVGYDLLEKNIELLKQGDITFLISQRPKRQITRAIDYLRNIISKKPVEQDKINMPIDIIFKENLEYYLNED